MLCLQQREDEEIVLETPAGEIVLRLHTRWGLRKIAIHAPQEIKVLRRKVSSVNAIPPRDPERDPFLPPPLPMPTTEEDHHDIFRWADDGGANNDSDDDAA